MPGTVVIRRPDGSVDRTTMGCAADSRTPGKWGDREVISVCRFRVRVPYSETITSIGICACGCDRGDGEPAPCCMWIPASRSAGGKCPHAIRI